MKRDYVDLFHVDHKHQAIHARLLNWASWARVSPHYATSPMFRSMGYRSNSRQWHAPEIRDTVDTLDALAIERMMRHLPKQHMEALRWWYVLQTPVGAYCRAQGLSPAGLHRLCNDARTMLTNLEVMYNADA